MKDELTAERLRELLNYSPETGNFTWITKSARGSNIWPGSLAGFTRHSGYRQIKVCKRGPIALHAST
jgi:hypothetical protein